MKKAFSLIEILVSVAILAILIAIGSPLLLSAIKRGKEAQSAANLRQWGAALALYLNDSNNELPRAGAQSHPAWDELASPENENAWFNVLPPLIGVKRLQELSSEERAALYRQGAKTIFQCPLAEWQGNEASAGGPRFSYAFNSEIFGEDRARAFAYDLSGDGNSGSGPGAVPMLFTSRASERDARAAEGTASDTIGAAQNSALGASDRCGGKVLILFFDGSARSFAPSDLMDSAGRPLSDSPITWNPWNPDAV